MKANVTPTIEDLVMDLVAAKAHENTAKQQRIALEELIVERLGVKEEGSQTHELANGVRVTITGGLNYSADMPLLMQLANHLPPNMRPLKTETKLDETGAKYLRNNEPEAWAILAPAITTKAAKSSVKVTA